MDCKESRYSMSEIRPQRANANRHTARGMQALETSLASDGWIGAITVAADGETFDGSARVEKTAENGMLDDAIIVDSDGTRPIVVRRTDIATATDPRAVRLGIAANRVASLNLEWEPDILASIADSGVDLGSLFTAEEWADVSFPDVPEACAGGDEFDTTPDDGPTRTQLGQLWSIGGVHRLLVGDCTDAANVARLMGGERAELLFADPEYDADTLWIEAWVKYCYAHWLLALGDKQHVALGARYIGRFNQFLVLFYRQFSRNLNVYIPLLQHLLFAHYRTDKAKNYHLNGLHSVIEVASKFDRASEHPHAKHVDLGVQVLPCFSDNNAIVADPFLGSGTTLIAAHRTGRRCYGMEIAPKYADVILRRAEAEGMECSVIDG